MAYLGLLAYWVVNTIRHQLKKEDIHSGWSEIVRIMNTQKAVTTLAQNDKDDVKQIRRCSEPNPKAQKQYDALKYKYAPFVKKKSVVLKSEFRECQIYCTAINLGKFAAKWVKELMLTIDPI